MATSKEGLCTVRGCHQKGGYQLVTGNWERKPEDLYCEAHWWTVGDKRTDWKPPVTLR